MADRIITAEAIISATDRTGDVFARIGKKLEGVGKTARSSVEVDKLSASLAAAQKQYAALDKLQSSMNGLAKARGLFNEQKNALTEHARAMRAADAPTKAMEARYKELQNAVKQTSAVLEHQRAAFADALRAAEQFGLPMGRIASEQARLKNVINDTTRAIEHRAAVDAKAAQAEARAEKAAERRAHVAAHHGIVRYATGAAVGVVGAHGVMRVAEAGVEAGAERQHVITGMLNAGMPMEEVLRAQTLAGRVAKQAPNLSVTELMELHKEARSAVQHPEEVFELLPELGKAASVLKGMGAQNANVADLVKAGETLGLMNDPHRFVRFLNGQVKAMAVMGRTIDTTQVYEAAKYTKSAGATLSDDFINLTLPSIIQDLHGSSAGDALASLTKRWRGGLNHQHLAVERLNQMGLLEDPKKIRRSKTGEILGYGGKLKGDDVLASEPDRYFREYFNPAAERLGAKTLSDKIKLLNETLPSVAANLGRILIQQEKTLAQHRKNYEAAPDLEQSVENQRKDPITGIQTLTASLNDLASAASLPMMAPAAHALDLVSNSLKAMADIAKDHPMLAAGGSAALTGGALAGAGLLASYVANGFGLTASATALDGSAAALTEAAVALGAKSVIPGGPIAKGGLGVALGEAAGAASAAGRVALPRLAAGGGLITAIGAGAYLIDQAYEAQKPGGGGMWAPATAETIGPDQARLADMRGQLDALDAQIAGIVGRAKDPTAYNPTLPPLQDQRADLANAIATLAASLRQQQLPSLPPQLPTFARGGGLTGYPPIDVTGKVQADVSTTTDVNVRFKLDVPPGFGVTKEFQSTISKPSVGLAMPSARKASNSMLS